MRIANVEPVPGVTWRTPYEPDGGAPRNLDLATPPDGRGVAACNLVKADNGPGRRVRALSGRSFTSR